MNYCLSEKIQGRHYYASDENDIEISIEFFLAIYIVPPNQNRPMNLLGDPFCILKPHSLQLSEIIYKLANIIYKNSLKRSKES